MNLKKAIRSREQFQAGEMLTVLYQGKYNGMHGRFVGLREDAAWADIEETPGIIRAQPVAWLRRMDYRFDAAGSAPKHTRFRPDRLPVEGDG